MKLRRAASVASSLGTLLAMIAAASIAAETKMTELNDLEMLRVRFNHDLGATRIVLLLSPT
jgi:hypothetical protein